MSLTGQATRHPRVVAETGVIWVSEAPGNRAGCALLQPQPAQWGDRDVSSLSIPPYRTMTHPVVERVPLVGFQVGQRTSRRLRLPQWVPGPAQYPRVGQSGRAGHEDGQRHPAHVGGGAYVGRLDLLGVHDEQRGGERRLVFPRLSGPVVALVDWGKLSAKPCLPIKEIIGPRLFHK